jgi:hypothetical protein
LPAHKEGLKTRLASHEWPAYLPWVLLGMRTTPKDVSAISSAELVYGTPLVLPGEFLDAAELPAADFLEHVQPGPFAILHKHPTSCSSGEMGVHQARRDAAAANTAICRPIRGGRSRCEDLRGDRRTAAAGLRGPAQAAHRAGTGDSDAAPLPWTAAEGADSSGCRNAPHLRGSRCWRGLSVAVLHSIVIV